MTLSTRPKTTLTKEDLSTYVKNSMPDWQKTDRFRLLEKKYGKYLYLPLAVPRIEPHDKAAFKQWFIDKSLPIFKRKADIANPTQVSSYEVPSFSSIDSKNILEIRTNDVWDVNPVSDMYEVFPEIKTQIDTHLPFEDLQYYSLWSSSWPVTPHRDAGPLCDLPFAFRIMLYDENPIGTLKIHRGLPDMNFRNCEYKFLKHLDTNAIAWNNFRALHSSIKFKQHMKILMIVAPTIRNQIDYDKLEILFDASIEKYKNDLWKDTNVLEDYIDVSAKY